MIALAVQKIQSESGFEAKMKGIARKARIYAIAKRLKLERECEWNKKMEKLDENYNVWTDGPQYLQKHYGDKVADAAKGDEWN